MNNTLPTIIRYQEQVYKRMLYLGYCGWLLMKGRGVILPFVVHSTNLCPSEDNDN